MVLVKNIKNVVIQNMADKKQKSKFEFLNYQNYLGMIKTSENSKMFRHIYVLNNGKKKDILKNGELSCAYYVSCILKIFNLIDSKISPHSTVSGTIKNMMDNSWSATKKLTPGNILVWENKSGHEHLGFYLGKDNAISNCSDKKTPIIHHYTYNNKRKIIKILTHEMIK